MNPFNKKQKWTWIIEKWKIIHSPPINMVIKIPRHEMNKDLDTMYMHSMTKASIP